IPLSLCLQQRQPTDRYIRSLHDALPIFWMEGIEMDVQLLKQQVITYSKEIDNDKLGFAYADVFSELTERLKRQQELQYQSGFEKGTIEERTEPKRLLPEAKSILSIAMAYPARMKDAPRSTKEERRGIFARASWGMDYHHVLRERL